MRKQLAIAISMLITLASLYCQSDNPVVLSYQRNFIRASMSTKIELLGDALRIDTINMTPLYVDALTFVSLYRPILGNDGQLVELAISAVKGVARWNDKEAWSSIRSVFTSFPDKRIRLACLEVIPRLQGCTGDCAAFLNQWFVSNLGATPQTDREILVATANALGKIADPGSFEALFLAVTGKYDSSIVQAASQAINLISTDYTPKILAIIDKQGIQDVYAAWRLAREKKDLSAQDKGRIAERVFSVSFKTELPSGDPLVSVRDAALSESLSELALLGWSEASPLVVNYFYQVQTAYRKGTGSIDSLIAAIGTLGKMATTEAAQALSIFLGLLNSETEQTKTYNEQLMLAVINSLGDLGDKTAFDYLLYVGYLNYPETVKKASRDALARLTW